MDSWSGHAGDHGDKKSTSHLDMQGTIEVPKQRDSKYRKDWLPFAPFPSCAVLLPLLFPVSDNRQYIDF
ncbi:MAG: hypothetical protein H6Q04_619 [Acidobacteria bacterium]|nr:hypothetical protein [Acidobacteriota bacterium]